MKPYREVERMPVQQVNFNYLHSSTHMAIKNTNSGLKMKWRMLSSASLYSATRMRRIIRACIVLDNFVLRHDTGMNRQLPPAPPNRGTIPYDDSGAKRDSISMLLPAVRS